MYLLLTSPHMLLAGIRVAHISCKNSHCKSTMVDLESNFNPSGQGGAQQLLKHSVASYLGRTVVFLARRKREVAVV